MIGKRRDLSFPVVRKIVLAMMIVYCVGYGMQVAGWYLMENNEGATRPFSCFLSRELVGALLIVAANAVTYMRLLTAEEERDMWHQGPPAHEAR